MLLLRRELLAGQPILADPVPDLTGEEPALVAPGLLLDALLCAREPEEACGRKPSVQPALVVEKQKAVPR